MRAIWLAALVSFAWPAEARPLNVEDVLRAESYGQVQIDPTERWAIVERRSRYDSAPRFDYGGFVERAVSRIMVVDLEAPARLAPLFPQEADAGYWSAGFSPSGRQLAVFRLQDDRLALGVVDMTTRDVRWLAVPPSLASLNPNPEWVGEDSLAYIARPDGRLPVAFGGTGFMARPQIARWDRQARGREPSVTVLGSGTHRDIGLDDGGQAVVLAQIASGTHEVLERGSIVDMALSADRRRLALIRRGPALQLDSDQLADPGALGRRLRLAIHDLPRHARQEVCAQCDVLPNLLAWSNAGAELLYYSRRDGEGWEQGRLYRFDGSRAQPVSLGNARPEVRNVEGSSYAVNAAWVGWQPLVWARSAGGQLRWLRVGPNGPTPIIGDGPRALVAATPDATYALSGATLFRQEQAGPPRTVLAGDAISTGVRYLDPHSLGSRRFYSRELREVPPVTVIRDGAASIVRLDSASGRQRWSIALPSPGVDILAVAARRASVIYRRLDQAGASTLTLALDRGQTVDLDEINSHLRETDPAERLAVHSTSRTGARLTHWLTLPANVDGPAPLIVIPYPGLVYSDAQPPDGDSWTLRPILNPRLLAAAGYAVLEPSLPRERPEGDFAGAHVDLGPNDPERAARYDPIGEMTQEVLAAINAAVATGRVDGTRMALEGHSFGGFAVMAIASRTDRFAAVVATAGGYDFSASYGRIAPINEVEEAGIQPIGPFGYFERGQAAFGGTPWEMPERYRARSPFYAAARIRTPALLVHGDLDIVPYDVAERMFMALYRQNRDAILLRYAGEGHVPTSPANIRDYWSRVGAFLDAHLRQAPGGQSRQ